jgi:hypothetical protein
MNDRKKKKSHCIIDREKNTNTDKTRRTREVSSTCDKFGVSKMMRGEVAVDLREDGPTPEGDRVFHSRSIANLVLK